MNWSSSEIKVLKALYLLDFPTRSEIASHAGLSLVSVSTILNRLIESGWATAAGKTTSRGGRPSVLYRLSESVGYALGIFIGVEQSTLAAIGATNHVISQRSFELDLSGPSNLRIDQVIDQVSRQALSFLEEAGLQGNSSVEPAQRGPGVTGKQLLAVGLAVPGMVDTERGVWLQGLQIPGIEHAEVSNRLSAILSAPILLEDPARCAAALAHLRMGRQAAGNLVLLYLGAGVGAGIILNGELYRGAHGLAGEVGHFIVDPDGQRCACGNQGCLETVLSVPSILRLFTQRLEEGVISSLQKALPETISIQNIQEAAQSGDRLTLRTLFELGELLGEACARIIQLYNPQTLLVGGPAGVLGEYFRQAAWQKIRLLVLPEMLAELKLDFQASLPGDEALGSALLAQRWAWQQK